MHRRVARREYVDGRVLPRPSVWVDTACSEREAVWLRESLQNVPGLLRCNRGIEHEVSRRDHLCGKSGVPRYCNRAICGIYGE